jgi:conjugative transfer signal peptidase TraF
MSDGFKHRLCAALLFWRFASRMDKTGPRITLLVWAIALLLWSAVRIGGGAGLSINVTPSMPIGLWIVRPLTVEPARDMIVAICAEGGLPTEELRSCPGDHPPLLKPVAAIPGDHVSVSEGGISVNGKSFNNSRALPVAGVPAMPLGHYTVADGEVWVIATGHPRSYDSRYLGPLPISNIRGRASRMLVWR